ncbi:MAG: DNA-protecting protein DprA [Oscillospiraceae bacterium]|nr:DNA-protecting protein DprA [Oscillospiraceae bacterium]
MSALQYWIWLSSLEGVSVRAKAAVIRRFGDAETAFFAPSGVLGETEGVSENEARLLEQRNLRRVDEILGDCEAQGLSILTMQDTLYPRRLRTIWAPPTVLYVKGRLPFVDDEAAIAVVGTRSASAYGIKMSRRIAGEIVRCGGVVISGLTNGIDAAAACGALEAGGVCIGVLGTAHEMQESELSRDVCQRGALVSEYAPGTRSQKSFFRDRNRISSGLSVGTVAIEAPEKSGTLLFAAEALEQGREVFAVPGNADAAGCRGTNNLLKEGATPVTCGWEVMREFRSRFPDRIREDTQGFRTEKNAPPESVPPSSQCPENGTESPKKEIDKPKSGAYIDLREQLASLNETQLRIISAIEKEPTHIDDIVEKTGLGAAAVLTQLTVMTVKGIVRRMPGNRVALNVQRR